MEKMSTSSWGNYRTNYDIITDRPIDSTNDERLLSSVSEALSIDTPMHEHAGENKRCESTINDSRHSQVDTFEEHSNLTDVSTPKKFTIEGNDESSDDEDVNETQ